MDSTSLFDEEVEAFELDMVERNRLVLEEKGSMRHSGRRAIRGPCKSALRAATRSKRSAHSPLVWWARL